MAVSLPVGQSGLLKVPIVPSLGQTLQNIVVLEGDKTVWANQAFVPGVPGIIGGEVNRFQSAIVFHVACGSYNFRSK